MVVAGALGLSFGFSQQMTPLVKGYFDFFLRLHR